MKYSISLLALIVACTNAQRGWTLRGHQNEDLARRTMGFRLNQNEWHQNSAQNNLGLGFNHNNWNNNFAQRGPTQNDDSITIHEIEDFRQRFERFHRAFEKFSKRFLEMLTRIQQHSHKRINLENEGQNEPEGDWWPVSWPMPGGGSW